MFAGCVVGLNRHEGECLRFDCSSHRLAAAGGAIAALVDVALLARD